MLKNILKTGKINDIIKERQLYGLKNLIKERIECYEQENII